ncbi:MAG TPA: peptidoglycan bridge formation glycyltransferase FemA/FemB family protein [Anaerolineae bacterium]|nr:peptidoglycan bridge formation glycyltransferase FemA/FemB family protein [Anaerolineae bacterium]
MNYQIQVSQETEDKEWDAFLAQTPGGHHVQTSLWAQVKAMLGWRVSRVIARQGSQILGGAQLLIRPMAPFGAVGYVAKGPLLASHNPVLAALVIDQLRQMAKEYKLQCFIVQPPDHDEAFVHYLPRLGFHQSVVNVGPTATVKIDLSAEADALLAGMKKATRKHIRRGLREGVTVREGTDQDLDTFYQLLGATAQRQGFVPYPSDYFGEMWRLFHPPGYARLFIAEVGGEAVAAHWVVPFGDTLISKYGGWSGQYGQHRPNEVLDWEVIMWAKSNGYRYHDLEGIDEEAAQALFQEGILPESFQQTPTSYKLGFGGQVTHLPKPYICFCNPVIDLTYKTALPQIRNFSAIQKVIHRWRTP